jgi:tRNA (guanosine-2'-O-)-methyltransferase
VTRNLGPTDLKRLHRDWRRRTDGRVALLLEDVQTPYNVGAILRSAAALRVEHLWLVGATAAPGDAKTQKTALGTQRFLTWTVCDSIAEADVELRADGYSLIGIELAEGAKPIHEADLADAVCLAVGHEDRGLSAACLSRCDEVLFIPQLGKVGSLNVATAASIAVYEARRQAWSPEPVEPTGDASATRGPV